MLDERPRRPTSDAITEIRLLPLVWQLKRRKMVKGCGGEKSRFRLLRFLQKCSPRKRLRPQKVWADQMESGILSVWLG
jgi:hypothetical protein